MSPIVQAVTVAGGGPAGAVAAAAKNEPSPPPNWPQELAAAFEKIPTTDMDVAVKVCQELINGGPAMIEQLVRLVGNEFGDPRGVKPKYALHGVVHWASRPGAYDEREMVAGTLAKQLSVADHSSELKAFLARQLQLCGRTEEAPALAKLLTDERLCEPAAQALQAIGGEASAAALRKALADVKGKQRVTVLQALGFLKDAQAVPSARPAAGESDWTVRLAALYALSSAGDAEAADLVWKAAQGEPCWQRNEAADACMRLARRLGELGRKQEAAKLLRRFLAERKGAEDAHLRCAAVAELAAVLGAEAIGDVEAALASEEPKLRVPSARIAVKLARAILKDKPKEAAALLQKVLKSTEEKAALQQAELLLAEAGQKTGAAGEAQPAGRRSSHGVA